MAYLVKKSAPCYRCGDMTFRRLRNKRIPCCIECAVKRAVDAVQDQRNHSGPWYDEWQASMRKYSERMGWTSPPPSTSVRADSTV